MKQPSADNLLEEDHASVAGLISQLCLALDGRDVERSFARLDLVWARLAVHIRAEHLCLFPAVLDAARRQQARAGGAARLAEASAAVRRLKRDHDFFMRELAGAVKALRELRSVRGSAAAEEVLRGVRRTITAVEARLEEHNRLEEEQVYRWPAAVLDSDGQARLAECVRREIGNQPPRFAAGAPEEDDGRTAA